MQLQLPVSRHIRVTVELAPTAARGQNLSTLLLLGSSNVIDTVERMRTYGSLEEVAGDFSSNMPEYLAALLWFEQKPQPSNILIGRWAATATSGANKGAPLSAAQQLLSNFTVISSGGFTYTRDAGGPTNVTGINLTGAANLNAVAALITAALTGAVMVWNAAFSRFELTSTLTGATSAISFLTAPGSGTDLSAVLGMRSTSSGAYLVPGSAAESAIAAVQLFDQNFGQKWYAVSVLGAQNADNLQISAYVEGTNTKHLNGITTQEAGVLVAATTSDIAYQMKQFGYNRTFTQFSSSSPYASASALAKGLTVNYGGNNTTLTLMYKQEPGIVPENLNTTQASSADGKNANYVAEYNNDTAILERGVMASGLFFDIVTGTDNLAVDIQTAVYNLFYTSPTKIPQTDAGTQTIVAKIAEVCERYVTDTGNGLLAPGVWDSAGFGLLKQGDVVTKGYYIYAPRVATQSTADRGARKSVPIQVAVKLAGAIHDIEIAIVVNQ